MIGNLLRRYTEAIVSALARPMARLGISPNLLTATGLAATLGAAVLLAFGHLRLGGLLAIPASILDALDGALAREKNRVTPYGAFFDSTLDRWGEIALYLGLLWWYAGQGASSEIILTYLALAGSLMVSYTRARAEGLGVDCKVGFFARFERLAVLIIGLLLGAWAMPWVLGILALFSNLTAVQRMWHVRNMARKASD